MLNKYIVHQSNHTKTHLLQKKEKTKKHIQQFSKKFISIQRHNNIFVHYVEIYSECDATTLEGKHEIKA